MKTGTSLAAILASLGGAHAFWRMECRGQVGLARLDPLIDPGVPSKHAHAIHGSSGFSASSTFEDLRNADCTSCAVAEDMSVYWAPAVYFKHLNGTYQEVKQDGGMLAYYFLNYDLKDTKKGIKAFPNDFRMVAGDSNRRNYSVGGLDYRQPDPPKSDWGRMGQTNQHDLAQRALGFNCLNYDADPEPALYRHYLPDKAFLDSKCKHGVRFELSFPSCWNGKDTSSPDHKSHVACRVSFSRLSGGPMTSSVYRAEFVISNGDVEGFGYHADFISGWEEDFLQSAVDQCTNASGQISDCPLFTILSADDQRKCKIATPPMIASEKLSGLIGDILPGNVKISLGPAPANHNQPKPDPIPLPVLSVPVPNVLPGGVFKEEPTSSPEAESTTTPSSTSTPTPTPTPTPSDPPIPKGYELVRTDYVTNGNVVSKIVVIETIEYVMMATETVTVTATPGADKARRELNQHKHQHQHLQRHRHGVHH
ncbi:hypothetical protein CHGG_02486 [Chaetomium globosum CBS 148.51]|uniref:DUF1996 domain-containing protein n=1 Tax=Chaetomium globosum (strain ATCC 6205 / CBS 148.51 / DSM 1962 / NBRC 6347 / NRRL 1970) TaxID=306901 RepID=Q2HBB8_CHAGB|nr:uncharacterized protein CHGG_02486 [Chaetomium globosum CBS 148.51]EAQ90551.1 hypothetical protein CHGG_02486 [Chaetomium globosum CBS 148.51]